MPSTSRGATTRDDILAILQANRELGPEFDEHTADQILEMMKTAPTVDGSQPAQEAMPKGLAPWEVFAWERHQRRLARDQRRRDRRQTPEWIIFPVMGLSIPLMGIAGHVAGSTGVVAVLAFDAFIILTRKR